MTAQYGSFYDGDKASLTVGGARVSIQPKFSVEPSHTLNVVHLTPGSFTSHLLGTRIIDLPTAFHFVTALIQYNTASRTVSTDVRLRWEYQPGSELFVVYNDERDTIGGGLPALSNRAFVVKLNRLFRL